MESFLAGINLKNLAKVFREKNVSMKTLLNFTAVDLKNVKYNAKFDFVA